MPDLALPPGYQRFRVLTSLGLDSELSRFEAKLLAAHASRCPDCRAYAEDVAAITAQIRGSDARRLTASGRTSWRARSRPRARGYLGAAALAMLLVVALGAGSSPGGQPPGSASSGAAARTTAL